MIGLDCHALERLPVDCPKQQQSRVEELAGGVSVSRVRVRVVRRGYVGLIEAVVGINGPFERVLTARMDVMTPLPFINGALGGACSQ